MTLSDEQLRAYHDDGYLLLEDAFSPDEVDRMHDEFERLKTVDTPGRVMEDDGTRVRALHGCHTTSDVFAHLTELPRLVTPARQLLQGDVYVYQFKINCKEAMGGDHWPWHQDFIFWKNEDGMPEPLAINVAVFLDPVTEFNGPLLLVPGSHQRGILDRASHGGDGAESDWTENVSADLKYTVDAPTLRHLVDEHEMVAPKGPPGTVLLFHPNVVHGSTGNLSPHDRRLLIVTYNRTDNAPDPEGLHRPAFLVSRDAQPIQTREHGDVFSA